MYKLCFYVPQSHLEPVKQAIFIAGAGKVGDYEQCCWQALGRGQFMAVKGSKPFIGETSTLTVVDEWRVEMVVEDEWVEAAVNALKETHPYEVPAYAVWQLADL